MKANKVILLLIIVLTVSTLFSSKFTNSTNNKVADYDNVSKDETSHKVEESSSYSEKSESYEKIIVSIESVTSIESIDSTDSETYYSSSSNTSSKKNEHSEENISYSSFKNIPMSDKLKSHIKYVSNFYNIEESLIYKIIYIESRFDKNARNSNCYGLMQVMKKYSRSFMKWGDEIDGLIPSTDIMNPYTNTVLGIRILKRWKDESRKLGYEQEKAFIEMYGKGYNIGTSRNYANRVLSINLDSIDFSSYSIVE